jgi:hypothetical protein
LNIVSNKKRAAQIGWTVTVTLEAALKRRLRPLPRGPKSKIKEQSEQELLNGLSP